MNSVKLKSNSETETMKLGTFFGERIKNRELNTRCFILTGDLGCGKTVFIKGFLKSFKYRNSEITSPTFIILRKFETEDLNIYHIDLYRLNNPAEIEGIGIYDFIYEENSVSLIEWGDKLKAPDLPTVKLEFTWIDENEREIIITSEADFRKNLQKSFNFEK